MTRRKEINGENVPNAENLIDLRTALQNQRQNEHRVQQNRRQPEESCQQQKHGDAPEEMAQQDGSGELELQARLWDIPLQLELMMRPRNCQRLGIEARTDFGETA